MSERIEFTDNDFCLELVEAACCEKCKASEKEPCVAEDNVGKQNEVSKTSESSSLKKVPKFKIVAYTGAPMCVGSYCDPIVIELGGIKALNKKVPIRMNHDRSCGVGHATKTYIENGALKAEVSISRKTDFAKDVYESAESGFPWQISVGGKPMVAKHYEEGETFVANGKTYKGPMTHIEQFELDEMSFCDLGADSRTSAAVSASRNLDETVTEEVVMTDEKVEATANEQVQEVVEEKEKVEEVVNCSVEEPKNELPVISETVNAVAVESKPYDAEKNHNRISAINSVSCNGYEELRAQAIEEGWSSKDFCTALKAARHADGIVDPNELPKVQADKKGGEMDSNVIEASLGVVAMGEKTAEKYYDSETLNRAYDIRKRVQGFRDLFSVATGKAVYSGDVGDMDYVHAAFTTTDLNKIFKNVLNKTLLAAYDEVSTETWRRICHISTARDFKPVYNYRTGGEFDYERIGQAGEVKNATFSEQEFTNKVVTYAKMFSLTREMIINDDLNALFEIVKGIGTGASKTINKEIFSLLLANGNSEDGNAFFSAAHSNYVEGTSDFDATLGIGSLEAAELALSSQLTPQGDPIIQDGKYLLVPNALKVKAFNLMNAIEVNETTTADKPKPNINPFAGRFEVISTPFLNTPSISGGSATDWYLFGDPNKITAIDVIFLNGRQQPTIEQKEAAFDRFGIQYKGFIDFGVKLQDWRGAVKVKV